MKRFLFGITAFLFIMFLVFIFAYSSVNPEWVYMKDNGQCYFVNTIPNKEDTTINPRFIHKITTVDCETLSPDVILYKFEKEKE